MNSTAIMDIPSTRNIEINRGEKKLFFTEMKKGSKLKSNTAKPLASLNTVTGQLNLGVAAVRTLAIENNFYKVYYDVTNKVIGFQIKQAIANNSTKLSGWRMAKLSTAGGLSISVKPACNDMFGLKPMYKKLEIKRYKDYTSKIDNETYYYVELK